MIEQGKALIHSWTFWLACLQAASGIIVVVQSYFTGIIPTGVIGGLMIVKSIIDVIVRVKTGQPITSVLPTSD